MTLPASDHPELFRLLRALLLRELPPGVLADWLEERGDARCREVREIGSRPDHDLNIAMGSRLFPEVAAEVLLLFPELMNVGAPWGLADDYYLLKVCQRNGLSRYRVCGAESLPNAPGPRLSRDVAEHLVRRLVRENPAAHEVDLGRGELWGFFNSGLHDGDEPRLTCHCPCGRYSLPPGRPGDAPSSVFRYVHTVNMRRHEMTGGGMGRVPYWVGQCRFCRRVWWATRGVDCAQAS